MGKNPVRKSEVFIPAEKFAAAGGFSWKRSGWLTGTDRRMSAVTALRLLPSTYSYLKLTVMPWAPLLQVGTACMGSSWVRALPGARLL